MQKKISTIEGLLNESRFGIKSYWIYLFLYTLITFLIFSKVEYFPDFYTYDDYIILEEALNRFRLEPFSAWLMTIMSNAREYYIVTWIISSVFLFFTPIVYGKRYFIYSVFVLSNPFNPNC